MTAEDLDPIALRRKYRAERDKRMRADGIAQYRDIGQFGDVLRDPYAPPEVDRQPVDVTTDVLLVGGGIATMVLAARLREAGVNDLWVVEKAGDFGGTWYWNRYPAAMCDVESHIYLPLLEETGYVPTRKYADSNEIREHIQRCGRHLGLYETTAFTTAVTSATWDEDEGRWNVRTDRGDVFRPRFLTLPSGQLLRPKLPGVPGIEDFEGRWFHTSRWDYAYTGGDIHGDLSGLADKRVGLVGTGATAVQCVAPVAESAAQLFVFQRTPAAVDARNNRPTDAAWAAALGTGWQLERMRNYTSIVDGRTVEVDLVADGWTEIYQDLTSASMRHLPSSERAKLLELADFRVMDRVRSRIDAVVSDPATAERLKPWYGRWCKRPCFHDEYLPAFNLPNVELVDTDGRGLDRVTPRGVIANGVEYELDCLVFATGFEVGTDYAQRVGFVVEGRDGQLLSEKWQNGPRSLHGLQVNGFPNLFYVGTTHTGITPNFTHMVEEQARHIAYIVANVHRDPDAVVETTAEAEAAWGAEIDQLSQRGKTYRSECTPSYGNGEGQVDDPNTPFAGAYGAGPMAFFELLQQWREDGVLTGVEVRSRTRREGALTHADR